MSTNYIATDGGRYRVMVDGAEVSAHTQYHTALAKSSAEKAKHPDSDVEVVSDFRVRVETSEVVCPQETGTVEPEPDPTPEPEPAPEPTPEPEPTEPENTNIAELAGGMSPGTTLALSSNLPSGFDGWTDFIRHTLTSVCPDQWGEQGHWHRERGQVFFLGDRTQSSQQRDPDDDDIVFVSYYAEDNIWVHNSKTGVRDSNDHHPYSQMTLDEQRNRYYRIHSDAAWVYDIEADTHEGYEGPQVWTRIDQLFPANPNSPKEMHEMLDLIVMADDKGVVYGVDPDDFSNQAVLGVRQDQAGYQSLMTYNRKRNEMLWIGGNDSANTQMVTLIDSQGHVTAMNDAPDEVATGISGARIFYDPVGGNYLLLDNSQDTGVMWEYSPEQDEWRVAVDYAKPEHEWWPGPYCGHVMVPLDGYGVIMWVTTYGVRLYRHKSVFAQTSEPPVVDDPEPTPMPGPVGDHPFYAIAADMAPGEFRPVETTLPEGVDSISRMNHTNWHPEDDSGGTFGVGWTHRHVFDEATGRLFNVLMRGDYTHSITWLEPDLSWTGIMAPAEAGIGGRRPYNRLFGLDGYLYWFPQDPSEQIGRITRAHCSTPDQWEDVGAPPLPADISHSVGDFSAIWHPEIGKFVIYIYGRGRYDIYGDLTDDGIDDYIQGRVYTWGVGDESWTPPETEANYLSIPVPEDSYPATQGRTQSSGYGGTTIYNPIRKEVMIYGGSANWSNPHPLGPQCTATIDEHGIFRRHGPSGQRYGANYQRLTYHPVSGDYILTTRQSGSNTLTMYIGDPPRGKAWEVLYQWKEGESGNGRPFSLYENWHRVTPLPGTDVLIWSDLRRGIILQRVEDN